MIYVSGLIIGCLLGFFMKRSRFCITGLIRDIYLLKKGYNLILIGGIIATQAVIYYAMGHAGLIRIPAYLPPFSLLAVGAGSLLFGFGAVLANGCLSATLVKCGDGRLMGWIILAVFMIVGYFMSAGTGRHLTRFVRSFLVVSDDLTLRRSILAVLVWAVIFLALCVLMWWHAKKHRPSFQMPARYKGLRHVFCEKIWTPEAASLSIGVLAGATYLVCEPFGRRNSFSIATPILSWLYTPLKPVEIIGGCNPFDTVIGWGSFFVLGIIVGSFVTAKTSGEFSVVRPAKSIVVKGIIGGVLMGIGAVWGLGCYISNGLVGTAQLSVKSWYALVFLMLGNWLATRIFIVPQMRD